MRNIYELRVRNMQGEPRDFSVSVNGDPTLRIELEGASGSEVEIAADETLKLRAYVTADATSGPANTAETPIRFWVEDVEAGTRAYVNSVYNGKGDSP